MNHTENWIGSQYRKVVYREYTNGEFVEIKARPPQEEHLQLLGMANFSLSAPSVGISLSPLPATSLPLTHHGILVITVVYLVSHTLFCLSIELRNFPFKKFDDSGHQAECL